MRQSMYLLGAVSLMLYSLAVPSIARAEEPAPALIGKAESVAFSHEGINLITKDAHGDILAPGILNINYIHVYGKGTHVAKVDVGQRSTNLNPAQASVCGGKAEIAYYKNGKRVTEVMGIPGCTLPSLMLRPGHYVSFNLNKHVDNNTPFCGRSDTGKGWSPYACVNIHK